LITSIFENIMNVKMQSNCQAVSKENLLRYSLPHRRFLVCLDRKKSTVLRVAKGERNFGIR
jgi:hypothetical protein